ncbi:MAG: right-handed parallel beta-helix repeat-containing protein [Lentisphaeria bacterium]|nr:right-handed parallel beta-helix repeat-containing protein [Lentisphaeria bacterium]
MFTRYFALLTLVLCAGCLTVVPNPLSQYAPPDALSARTGHGAAELAIFVSPCGDDAWTGTLPAPNDDGTDGPLGTIKAAQAAVRALRANSATQQPVTVFLREGVYALDEALVFTPDDSGAKGAPTLYRPFGEEDVSISGGTSVTGWTRSGGLLVAHLPEGVNPRFHRLYINGYRRTLARTPNEGHYHRIARMNGIWDEKDGTTTDVGQKRSFAFHEGDFPKLPGYAGVNAVAMRNWESAILPVQEVNFERHAVLFTGPMKWDLRKGDRYYLEGFRDALDARGEWWCDREAGLLYYKPLRGERVGALHCIVPRLTELVVLKGDPGTGRYVEHLTFEGITFRDTDYLLPPTGHSDWQAAVTIPAAIQADGARDVVIRRCVVRNIGQYGIWFRRGCIRNTIEQTEVYDLGAGGIRIGDERVRKKKEEQTSANTVHNCFIHDGSSVFYGAIPLWVGQSSDNTLTHNEICDFNYTGLSVGWSWGFGPTACHRNEIAYNHLHHLGRGVLYDMAAIYTLGISTGTHIHHNLIHHIWGFLEGYGAGGIYPDEGSSGLLIENNVVYETQNGGLTVHYGRDIVARNNIFAFGQRSQVHLGRKDKGSSQTFRNNIILYREGGLFQRMCELEADRNLYWSTGEDPLAFPGGLTFAKWQEEGYDQNSLIADPLFLDAEKWDFRLAANSPALALGFKPIDISTAGLVGEAQWTDRPGRVRRPKLNQLPRKAARPPTPVFDDFETSAAGAAPAFGITHGVKKTGASISVTDECAATGKRSLKFVDAAGMKNDWDPHLYVHPRFTGGTVTGSFDLRLEKGAILSHQWRTDDQPFVTGPTILATAGGALVASGETIIDHMPVGEWVHIELRCRTGKKPSGEYTVTVTLPDANPVVKRVPCSTRFKALNWCVFVSDATEHTVFYLDNVKISSKD